jgi:predicted kinase
LFRNAYVEQQGDHASLELLRWYEVYRALVRGKVASLRAQQLAADSCSTAEAEEDRDRHISLAHALSSAPAPTLTITHGVSGSGKSTYSERLVARSGAIRVRADVERKRLHGLQPSDRVEGSKRAELYSEAATQATYLRLYTVAEELLVSGYSVVLDATFLKQKHRRTMHELADRLGVDFAILDCVADSETLSQRVHNRQADELEPSDADASVLEAQLASREHLTESEQALVMLPLAAE